MHSITYLLSKQKGKHHNLCRFFIPFKYWKNRLTNGRLRNLIEINSRKLFILNDDRVVYPGHGPKRSIGFEKENNPFLN